MPTVIKFEEIQKRKEEIKRRLQEKRNLEREKQRKIELKIQEIVNNATELMMLSRFGG